MALDLPPAHPFAVPGFITGELRAADGAPFAGRDVSFVLRGYQMDPAYEWGAGALRVPWVEMHPLRAGRIARRHIMGTVVTDPQGRYRLSVPPGSFFLSPRAEGCAAPRRPVAVPPGGSTVAEPFNLAECARDQAERREGTGKHARIRVRVLRPDGTPLAHTGVYLFTDTKVATARDGSRWNDYEGEELANAYVTTDAEGRFERGGLPAGSVLLALKTRGFAETEAQRVDVAAGGADVELLLREPAMRAAGRVLAADGRPARRPMRRACASWTNCRRGTPSSR